MNEPVAAVCVAAGSGERLGTDRPKALVELAGMPIVARSVAALRSAAAVHHLVVVAPDEWQQEVAAACEQVGAPADVVVAGGATRTESVRAGVTACPPGTAVVVIHDAARPLVTPALVDRVVGALQDPWAAVAPGLPATDTVKLVSIESGDGYEAVRVQRTLDRRVLWTVQTPQAMRHRLAGQVHARLPPPTAAATDDVELVERAGGRVRLVRGDPRNVKITHPDDLRVATALLAAAEDEGDS